MSILFLFGYLLAFVLIFALYFLPSIIAYKQDKCHFWAIFLLNFLLGGTGIVWIACLIWAINDSSNS